MPMRAGKGTTGANSIMTDWQPIETAPKDGRSLLIWSADEGIDLAHHNDWGRWQVQETADYDNEYFVDLKPTHWMPLPEPPEGEG